MAASIMLVLPILVIMSVLFFTGPSFGDAPCLGKKSLCGILGALNLHIFVPLGQDSTKQLALIGLFVLLEDFLNLTICIQGAVLVF
jgi:hypothetical protein